MGLFNLFKKQGVNPLDVDYMSKAEEFERTGDFSSAINEYNKIIQFVYAGKESKHYRHVTRKIVLGYAKLGDYDKVFEM